MRGPIPALLAIALSACAATDQVQRKPAGQALAQSTCPQPGSAEYAQAALAARSHLADLISSDELRAFGPTRIIWVHPPDGVVNRCR